MRHMLTRAVLVLQVFALGGLVTARAVTRTWDGGGANDNWSTTANWDNNALPETTADVIFATGFGSGTSIDLGTDRTVNSFTINTTTAFSITGGDDLTLTSGLLTRNNVSGTENNHSITAAIILGANGVFDINGSGSLTISGAIEDGAGTLSFTKTGSGLLVLAGGVNTYNGDTIVNGGILQLGADNKIGDGAGFGNLVVNSGGTFDLAGFSETVNGLSGGGIVDKSTGTETETLTVGAGNTSATFTGTIQDSDADDDLNLTKIGTGTQTLSGTNTYAGATAVNAGALRAASSAALGATSGGVTVSSGAALELSGGITIGAEALSLSGTGISSGGALRNITGNNSWAGTITLADVTGVHRINSDADTLTIGGGITEAGNSNNKDLTFGGSGNVTVNGNITASSGDMRVFKDGSGTLTLAGANTYDGTTTIGGGVLAISANGNLGSGGGLIFANGATLRTTGGSVVLLGTRTVTLNSGGGTLDIGVPIYISGAISGGNGLTTGGNDLILNRGSGNNAIGALTINSGRVFVQNTLGNINGSTIAVQNGAILDIDINAANVLTNTVSFASGGGLANRQGTLSMSTANAIFPTAGSIIFNNDDQPTTAITVTGNYPTLTGDLTIQVGGGNATVGTVTLSGAISGSGGLTKTSTGTLILGSANSYTGNTVVSAGILQLGNAGAIPSGASAGNVTVNGTLSLQDLNVAINGLNGSGTVRKDAGAASTRTLTIGNNNASGSFSGVLTDTSGTLNVVKTGNGTQIFSGNNSYDGTNAILAGVLKAQHNNALGTVVGNTTVAGGASLQIDGSSLNVGENLILNGDGGGAGALVNLVNNNNASGTITFASAGRINSDAGTFTLSGATMSGDFAKTFGGAGNITVSNIISGASAPLTYDGSGTLTLSGANTYGGTTTVKSGTLAVGANAPSGSAGALGNASSAVLVGDTSGSGSAALLANGAFTIGRNVTIQSGSSGTATVGGSGANNSIFSGDIVANKNVQLTAATGGQATFSGTISGNHGITKVGAGTVVLSHANTFTGGVTINSGVLRLDNAGALNSTTPNAVAMNGGTLRLNGNSVTVAGLSGSAGTVENGGSGLQTLTVNKASGSDSFAGVIQNGGSGTLALDKTGAGEMILSGANTYTGGTTLTAGTLTLGANEVLADSGAFKFAGGVLNANNRTETFGALSLTADSTLSLVGDGLVNGTLTFSTTAGSATGILTITGWVGAPGGEGTDDRIFFSGAAPDSDFLSHILFDLDGELYFADMVGNELVAGLSPVPEPTEWALIIFGMLAVFYKFVLPRWRARWGATAMPQA